jgi:hypothetical protein
MFPVLTSAQVQRICRLDQRRQVKAGEILFDAGENNTEFLVVVDAEREIVRPMAGRGEASSFTARPDNTCAGLVVP